MKKLMLNQKSGLKYSDIETYVTKLKSYQKNFVVFPSSIYINEFVKSGYNTGIQNIAEKTADNQTGEITAPQAISIGVKSVIIGHSERRNNQNETSEVLINKFGEALNNKLNIVYCIGESLVEYKMKNTNTVLFNELDEVLSKIDKSLIKNLYIAYEPIWAIGSGMTPTTLEISTITAYIKDYLSNNNIKAGVLYGGSVNDKNIEELSKIENVDGFLVGGASNDYNKVIKMCEIVNDSTK
ncbi:MAG: triosephosphate isomerase [Bacilli bacterium]|nr:triosephosphate isomerase [Bacilli bacterium]